MNPDEAITSPFLRRVRLRNFKSIAICDVELKARTILIGRNGAGKSNFVDALHFIADALRTSLDGAIDSRGGAQIVHLGGRDLSIGLSFGLPHHRHAEYELILASAPSGRLSVAFEKMTIVDSSGRLQSELVRKPAGVEKVISLGSEAPLLPPPHPGRLYLFSAAVLPDFADAFDALRSMAFYHFNPDAMKAYQPPSATDEILLGDGSNLASVIGRLPARSLAQINDYLSLVTPDVKRVEREQAGPVEGLVFYQQTDASSPLVKFYANSMSNGTLLAVGILAAAEQTGSGGTPLRLIGIEEPETALHPVAAGAIMEALGIAAEHTQVIVTTHSPDLLDEISPPVDGLLVASARNGVSRITTTDAGSVEAIKRHLFTSGELLRMDQLQGNEADYERQLQALERG